MQPCKQSWFLVPNTFIGTFIKKSTSHITIYKYRFSGQKWLLGKQKCLFQPKFTDINRSDFTSTEVTFLGQEWLLMYRSDIFFPRKNRSVFLGFFFTQKCLFPKKKTKQLNTNEMRGTQINGTLVGSSLWYSPSVITQNKRETFKQMGTP